MYNKKKGKKMDKEKINEILGKKIEITQKLFEDAVYFCISNDDMSTFMQLISTFPQHYNRAAQKFEGSMKNQEKFGNLYRDDPYYNIYDDEEI